MCRVSSSAPRPRWTGARWLVRWCAAGMEDRDVWPPSRDSVARARRWARAAAERCALAARAAGRCTQQRMWRAARACARLSTAHHGRSTPGHSQRAPHGTASPTTVLHAVALAPRVAPLTGISRGYITFVFISYILCTYILMVRSHRSQRLLRRPSAECRGLRSLARARELESCATQRYGCTGSFARPRRCERTCTPQHARKGVPAAAPLSLI